MNIGVNFKYKLMCDDSNGKYYISIQDSDGKILSQMIFGDGSFSENNNKIASFMAADRMNVDERKNWVAGLHIHPDVFRTMDQKVRNGFFAGTVPAGLFISEWRKQYNRLKICLGLR